MASFLPSSSEEELDLVLFVLAATDQWAHGSVDNRASALISLFDTAWCKFAKIGPSDGQFNKWWNASCSQAKIQYNAQPCMHARLVFQAACKSAKKAYFTLKLEDMVKHCKPWLGTCWIKDWPIARVPQIQTAQGRTINELQPMFDAFQNQFQPPMAVNIDIEHPFLQSLPDKLARPFVTFSFAELQEALATCSTSSAPGPSHMSWSLLKLFLADDAFHLQFLQLAMTSSHPACGLMHSKILLQSSSLSPIKMTICKSKTSGLLLYLNAQESLSASLFSIRCC